MNILNDQTECIGALSGVERDRYNDRDKGGYLEEILETRGELEQLIEEFDQGRGRVQSFEGFSNTCSGRGVFRALVQASVLEEFHSDRFPASVGSGYSLEATVPIEDELYLAWIGTISNEVERPPESHFSHRAGEISEALEPNLGSYELPEPYSHQFLGSEASEQDRNRTEELWADMFDDCYVVEIDREFVDSVYDGDVLASVVRDVDEQIVSTAVAEAVRVPTPVGELEIVELSEFATDPEHESQGLGGYNGAQLLEVVQDHSVDAVYSQNTTSEPGMTSIASNLGGEPGGVLIGHGNVSNRFQDLFLTYFGGDIQ